MDNIYKRKAKRQNSKEISLNLSLPPYHTMVSPSSLHTTHVFNFSSSSKLTSSLFLGHHYALHPSTSRRQQQQQQQYSTSRLTIRAYMDNSNSFGSFANKVIGSLPVVGLIARILSDEGGVGNDMIDFAEFRRRVGKKCTINDSKAFYEFQDRRGRVLNYLLPTP